MKDVGYALGMALFWLFTQLFNAWKKKYDTKKKLKEMPKLMEEKSKIREEVGDYIIKLQGYTGASRVALFEYSNGSTYLSNSPRDFIECTYEKTDETTAPLINQFKRVSIEQYSKLLNQINEAKDYFKVTDHDDDKEANKIQQYWGIKAAYNFKITESVWDGVVAFTWVNRDVELTADQILGIQLIIMRIRYLMEKLVKK